MVSLEGGRDFKAVVSLEGLVGDWRKWPDHFTQVPKRALFRTVVLWWPLRGVQPPQFFRARLLPPHICSLWCTTVAFVADGRKWPDHFTIVCLCTARPHRVCCHWLCNQCQLCCRRSALLCGRRSALLCCHRLCCCAFRLERRSSLLPTHRSQMFTQVPKRCFVQDSCLVVALEGCSASPVLSGTPAATTHMQLVVYNSRICGGRAEMARPFHHSVLVHRATAPGVLPLAVQPMPTLLPPLCTLVRAAGCASNMRFGT